MKKFVALFALVIFFVSAGANVVLDTEKEKGAEKKAAVKTEVKGAACGETTEAKAETKGAACGTATESKAEAAKETKGAACGETSAAKTDCGTAAAAACGTSTKAASADKN